MGSAIECFDGASAVVVPRTRFAPVKTTSDLFVLRSDVFTITTAATVEATVAKVRRGGRRDLRLPPPPDCVAPRLLSCWRMRGSALAMHALTNKVGAPIAAPQVPLVKLDDAHYKLVDKLERLVKVPPSMKGARSLTVKGPVRFGAGVVIK